MSTPSHYLSIKGHICEHPAQCCEDGQGHIFMLPCMMALQVGPLSSFLCKVLACSSPAPQLKLQSRREVTE